MDGILCSTAEEFLEKIGRRNPEWQALGAWLFRGQADADWELVPSVLRGGHRQLTWEQQVNYEGLRLFQYFWECQKNGLPVPGELHFYEGIHTGNLGPRWASAMQGQAAWPPDEWLPLMALAQHYGVPTRLLDWSSDPFVAAYMAAVEVTKWIKNDPRTVAPDKTSGALAVWALNEIWVTSLKMQRADGDTNPMVKVVGAPPGSIPNLAAQKGSFTVVQLHQSAKQEPHAACLTQVLGALRSMALRKYMLPHSQAPRLLRLLSMEFVSAASMFPGYGGIAEYVMHERNWHER